MSRLTTRRAIQADRSWLQSFECGTGRQDPTWLGEVRTAVRRLRPPLVPPRVCVVACGEDGGVAVSTYVNDPAGSEFYHVQLLAVLTRCQRERVGEAILEDVLHCISRGAVTHGHASILVTANVHRSNRPSHALFSSAGFSIGVGGREPYRQFELVIEVE